MFFKITTIRQDSLPILSAKKIAAVVIQNDYVETICDFINYFIIYLQRVSVLPLSTDKYMKVTNKKRSSSNVLYDAFRNKINIKDIEDENYFEEENYNKPVINKTSLVPYSDKLQLSKIYDTMSSSNVIVDIFNKTYSKTNIHDNLNLVSDSELNRKVNINSETNFNIEDEFELFINNVKV